jgi:hypothetical protein
LKGKACKTGLTNEAENINETGLNHEMEKIDETGSFGKTMFPAKWNGPTRRDFKTKMTNGTEMKICSGSLELDAEIETRLVLRNMAFQGHRLSPGLLEV